MYQAMIPPNSSTVLAPRNEPITLSGIVFGLSRFAATLLGTAVLIFSLLVGLAVVADLPGLFASGGLDPKMPHELNEQFGTAAWPHLMRQAGSVVSFLAALIGTGLLLLARRRWGAPHMFRALAATIVLFVSLVQLGRSLPSWTDVPPAASPGDFIENFLQMIHTNHLMVPAGLVIFATFLLLWPPRKARNAAQVNVQEQPVVHA